MRIVKRLINTTRLFNNSYLINRKNIRLLSGFSDKHTANNPHHLKKMLLTVKCQTTNQLINETIPENITNHQFTVFPELSEPDAIINLKNIASKNIVQKNLIGLDFNDAILPSIIQRKILENPKWYTAYTPYQAEISQGRLEAQFNFQTLICELTGMEVANISLLDSGSAATEALNMSYNISKGKRNTFFCSKYLHPVIIDILKTRANIMGVTLIIDAPKNAVIDEDLFGFLFSYPDRYGNIDQHSNLLTKLRDNKTVISCHANLMSLLMLKSPGEIGVDISFGSAQQFGIPLWFGGPHPAFFSTKKEYIRLVPGRIIGKTIDVDNNSCFRIALQTREQHIKKEKATSNICTSQSLLSVVASMYSIYHGRDNLIRIASEINNKTKQLAKYLISNEINLRSTTLFDTITFYSYDPLLLINRLDEFGYSALINQDRSISLTINEALTTTDITTIAEEIIKVEKSSNLTSNSYESIYRQCCDYDQVSLPLADKFKRDSQAFLTQDIFHKFRTETDLLRYIQSLENKDYTLTEGMIPLGSCTMKLNATSELLALSDINMQNIHPYCHPKNREGYHQMIDELSGLLTNLIGLPYISYQSNSGAMGEYSGLLAIKSYHDYNNNTNDNSSTKSRNICIIPESAHGTNFASAKLAGLTIKKYDDQLPFSDFKRVVQENSENLACLMITYPNTYGIFDTNIKEVCDLIHEHGGLVYMDGANMNAQLAITNPGTCGADVCHLNLHKTFCIPHGGGGPGMGPILVNSKLTDYLPTNILTNVNGTDESTNKSYGSLTLSEFSSASILSITYQYLKMMGSENLKKATEIAILNANYLKNSLEDSYQIFKTNDNGRVGHEFIISCDEFNDLNIRDVDIAKRLIDYSFHPPTMSWPIVNSLMIEPTESESKTELDRFILAMKSIRAELDEIRNGDYSLDDNVFKNAPHSIGKLKNWTHSYSIEKGCFPVEYLNTNKFWPSVSRVNDVYGDKNLVVK